MLIPALHIILVIYLQIASACVFGNGVDRQSFSLLPSNLNKTRLCEIMLSFGLGISSFMR